MWPTLYRMKYYAVSFWHREPNDREHSLEKGRAQQLEAKRRLANFHARDVNIKQMSKSHTLCQILLVSGYPRNVRPTVCACF